MSATKRSRPSSTKSWSKSPFEQAPEHLRSRGHPRLRTSRVRARPSARKPHRPASSRTSASSARGSRSPHSCQGYATCVDPRARPHPRRVRFPPLRFGAHPVMDPGDGRHGHRRAGAPASATPTAWTAPTHPPSPPSSPPAATSPSQRPSRSAPGGPRSGMRQRGRRVGDGGPGLPHAVAEGRLADMTEPPREDFFKLSAAEWLELIEPLRASSG